MKYLCSIIISLMIINYATAQGPPITADKPIMLGANTVILKTLTEVRNTAGGTFTKVPFMAHWLPSSNSLVAVHVPLTHFSFNDNDVNNGSYLGDIGILGKYQFYRKDGMAKTHRLVLKSYQLLPTGQDLGPFEISNGTYQHYLGIVSGYETIKYGISAEVGYNAAFGSNIDEWRTKLGFGLPLLKPTYPVNQINLYFEYTGMYRPGREQTELLYAQGIQYAKGRLTLEVAVQIPIYQSESIQLYRLNSDILIGTRYIF